MHLYETHLPVADTEAARRFYVEIVGLHFAHRDLTRDIVFLWAGADRKSMLSLWGSSGEVACAIFSASGVPVRFSAETGDTTARRICG
jgi:catechol 2,3-dioxygenase-like lactoylglutathione lyase family enzyme